MLQLLNDMPASVVAVRATGNITESDYRDILAPALERVAKEFRRINFLMILETDVKNITYGAWMQDAKESFKQFTKWNKIAIVSDQKIVEKMSYIFGYLSPAEAKGFNLSETEMAKQWVAELTDAAT